jgi:hypothetical protein
MIPQALASFLEQGLSIHVGTRDEQLRPAGARAAAVVVEPGGTHLRVFVADTAVSRLLDDIRANGQLAVDFGRPEDDRACQVKGTVVDIGAARPEEREIVLQQWQGFLEQLEKIGIPRQVAKGWAHWPATVIRIKVTAVFEQTPGPLAGTAIA